MEQILKYLLERELKSEITIRPVTVKRKIRIADGEMNTVSACSCSNACGSNYSRGNCSCYNSCGNNFSKSGNCSCYTSCGSNYAQ